MKLCFPLTRPRGTGKSQFMHAVVATVRIKDPEVARDALAGLRLNPGAEGIRFRQCRLAGVH